MSFHGDEFKISNHTLCGKYVLTAGVVDILKMLAEEIFNLNTQLDEDQLSVVRIFEQKDKFIKQSVKKWMEKL